MKSTVNNLIAPIFLVFILVQGFAFAQCTKTLVNRSGTVYSAGPAKESFRSKSETLTIKVAKQDGRAETIANIYVDNVRKKFLKFTNGKYTKTKTAVLQNTKGKNVRIEIINQSVSNKFKYRLTVKGDAGNNLGMASGRLVGQTKKTQQFDRVCTSYRKIRISINRKGGTARGTVSVKKNGRQIDSKVMGNRQDKLVLSYGGASNAVYTVELKNVSVGNTLSYSMTAVQTN